MKQSELVFLFVNWAHLALNNGVMFGHEGEGFMRMNIATPRLLLEQALQQLKDAVNNHLQKYQ